MTIATRGRTHQEVLQADVFSWSELPELLALSDRIIVLAEGRVAAEFPRAEATEQKIMEAATGGVQTPR